MLKAINLTNDWVITSWRTLFIFRSNVFTAVQSCSINLKGKDSMPPPSSRPVKGHSTDGLPASWLTRGYRASPWSTSFDSFRDRFLTRENTKNNTEIWKLTQFLASSFSELKDTLHFTFRACWHEQPLKHICSHMVLAIKYAFISVPFSTGKKTVL